MFFVGNLCEKSFLSTENLCGHFFQIKTKYLQTVPLPDTIRHLPTLPCNGDPQPDFIPHCVVERFPCDAGPSLVKEFSAHSSHPFFQNKL